MPRYVCDFDQVISAGEELIDSAIEMNTITKNYSSNIDNDLEGWKGQAKTNFSNQCSELVSTTSEKADLAKNFGEFIKSSAQSIQKLEEELSTFNI